MEIKMIKFDLPYPVNCSINHLYNRTKNGCFVNKTAKKYKDNVYYLLHNFKKFGSQNVQLEIIIHPPDKRKRDLDNILKIVFDSLEFSKIIENDFQIVELCVKKKEVIKNGILKITISEILT